MFMRQAGLRERGDALLRFAGQQRVAPVGDRARERRRGFLGGAVFGSPSWRPRVGVGLRGDVAGHFPARLGGRGVKPAGEVPAGDVGRVEQLLAGGGGQPRPGGRVDRAADRAQQAGVVDDRRGDELRAFVEVGVLQDRLDHRADAVARARVQALQRGERRFVGRARDEVAPQLGHEERRVQRVVDAQADGVFLVPVARLAEHGLRSVVVGEGSKRKLCSPSSDHSARQPVSARAISRTSSSV